jgi:CubicO group peptidase (beta-lactamase class C family)
MRKNAITALHEQVTAGVGPSGRLGVQLYASLAGSLICDIAVGEFRTGHPMRNDDPMPWLCSSKIATVLLFAQQYDLGTLSTSMPVRQVIPEFAASGKQDVTFDHLLTHTVVFRHDPDDRPWELDRESALARVYRWRLADEPGVRASYSMFASWLVLSEALQRVTGLEYDRLLRTHLLDPLDMRSTSPQPTAATEILREREGGTLAPLSGVISEKWPGTNLWGPASELARLLECVVAGGVWRDDRLLSNQAVTHFFTACREGIADEYFSHLDLSWGRGVCVDPAWFGAPSGARVAGHTGQLTSLVVGDLDRRLVVAYLSNTAVVGETVFRRLDNRLVRHLYEATT